MVGLGCKPVELVGFGVYASEMQNCKYYIHVMSIISKSQSHTGDLLRPSWPKRLTCAFWFLSYVMVNNPFLNTKN